MNDIAATIPPALAWRRSERVRVPWRRVRAVLAYLAGAGVLLLGWELAGRAGVANGFVLTPGETLATLADAKNGALYARSAAATFSAAATGLAIGGALAGLSALVAHQVRPLRRIVDQVAALANSAPWVAVGPVVLVVAGRESGPVAIAALAVYFFFFVAVSTGLSASEGSLRGVFRSLGASPWHTATLLTIPRAWPSLAEGFKLAAPAALAGAVYGEWYGSSTGLGVLLISGMQGGDVARLWAASLIAAAGGMVVFAAAAIAQSVLRRRYGSGIVALHEPDTRSTWRRVLTTIVEVVAITAALLGLWQLWITLGKVSPLVAPGPARVFADLAARPAEYAELAGHTLSTSALALLLGVSVGVLLAVFARLSFFTSGLVVPAMVVLTATPLVAMFPLLARLFGYRDSTVVVIAAVLVVLPAFVYTRSGMDATLPLHRDVARSLGAGGAVTFRFIGLPSALPHMSTGLRIAASSAIVATVIGESLIGSTGLGVDFTYQYRLLNMAPAFGSAILIVVLSLLVFLVFGWFDRLIHRRFGA
ncbi:ABC transporter permease subunit [Microbacterium enclense]|uniref:ABC transporter permease subunit n=1 Tax=Microbacterium enclense TaxID=993073 RepID=A0A3S3LCK9_9MICO|nr:ABC transporter permease subunit [Microbacterium enclense]RWR17270.1 ABC transporter permease subunit [Microbacterium enclense]